MTNGDPRALMVVSSNGGHGILSYIAEARAEIDRRSGGSPPHFRPLELGRIGRALFSRRALHGEHTHPRRNRRARARRSRVEASTPRRSRRTTRSRRSSSTTPSARTTGTSSPTSRTTAARTRATCRARSAGRRSRSSSTRTTTTTRRRWPSRRRRRPRRRSCATSSRCGGASAWTGATASTRPGASGCGAPSTRGPRAPGGAS